VYNSFLLPKAHSAFSVALPLSSVFFFIFNFFWRFGILSLFTLHLPMEGKKNTNRKHIKATKWREEGEEENQISFVYIK
jgi:hypothetical protein